MSVIQRPDLVQKLRAAYGIITGSVGSTLSDEIVPVVIVEDVTSPDTVSTGHPLDAAGSSSSAAAVGFISKVGLQNPVGSELDLFLEYIHFMTSVSIVLTVRKGVIAASPNAGIRGFRDLRVIGSPVGITWDENGTGTLGTQIETVNAVSGDTFLPLGYTLAPGDSIHAQGVNTNAAIQDVHFYWSERIRRE